MIEKNSTKNCAPDREEECWRGLGSLALKLETSGELMSLSALLQHDRPDSQGRPNYLHHNDAIKPRDTNIKYFGILRSTISYRHGVL